MNIKATLSYSENTLEDLVQTFNPRQACLFWMGISASNTAEQKKYEEKIAKVKQFSSKDKVEQDLTKIILRHEHKQRGHHLVASLQALKSLQQALRQKNYSLDQFIFCETSFLHRHNRLYVDELKELDIEEAGQKAIECFGEPWVKDAKTAMATTFTAQDKHTVESWQEWLSTEVAERYIKKTHQEYQCNPDFKQVVDQAASKKILSNDLDNQALQNSIAYILEEAAKVFGLKEEFSDFNLIIAYPGELPPAIQYLMTQQNLNLVYFKIEFSSTLQSRKQNQVTEVNPNTRLSKTELQANLGFIAEAGKNASNAPTASPVQQLFAAINNLSVPETVKKSLRRQCAKTLLQNNQSTKELLNTAKELVEHATSSDLNEAQIENLRSTLITSFYTSQDANSQLEVAATQGHKASQDHSSLRQVMRKKFKDRVMRCLAIEDSQSSFCLPSLQAHKR